MSNNSSKNQGQPSDDGEYIFVKYITLKNGKRIYAASYGKQAFRIRVRRK